MQLRKSKLNFIWLLGAYITRQLESRDSLPFIALFTKLTCDLGIMLILKRRCPESLWKAAADLQFPT